MKKILSFVSALLIVITASAAEFPAQPNFGELNFNAVASAAAKAPQSKQALPVYLALAGQTYNTAAFTWSYYGYLGAGFCCRLLDADKNEIGYITWTFEAFQYIMDLEEIPYEVDGEYPINYWVDTYWILNAPAGLHRGTAWSSAVYEVTDGTYSIYALREGTYTLQLYELTESGVGGGPVSINFTLVDPKAKNLKATVAPDNKTATLTWDQPTLPAGARLYVNVQSGAETAYDNYASTEGATSPLTVNVNQGRTYSASVQAIDASAKPVGSQSLIYFTVGTNDYIPTNLNAAVAEGDQVTFSWSAPAKADKYRIVVYDQYGERAYTVNADASPVVATLETGSYTWTLTPYELGQDEFYYPLSDPVAGNPFSTETAPLPAGTTELNAWYMDAAYAPYTDRNIFDENDPGIIEGKFFWMVRLYTGENEADFPQFWIYFYTDKNWAISGRYNDGLGNVYTAGRYSNSETAPAIGTNVDLKLNFQGFDFEMEQLGKYDAVYSGFCDVTVSGTKYRIHINNLVSPACNMSYFVAEGEVELEYYDMIDEDPSSLGIEEINIETGEGARKMLIDGHLYIIRDGKAYNIQGARVK